MLLSRYIVSRRSLSEGCCYSQGKNAPKPRVVENCVYHKPPQSQVARDGVGETYHGAVRTCIPLLGSGVTGTVTGAGRDGSSTVLMCGSVSLFVSKLLHAKSTSVKKGKGQKKKKEGRGGGREGRRIR